MKMTEKKKKKKKLVIMAFSVFLARSLRFFLILGLAR